MSTIVIMPGGFHPFHAGHASLYNAAKKAFPDAEVYVAATNDQKERPFPFSIKEKLAKLAGVEQGHFIQVKSPFQAKEITSHFNPEQDVLIFVRSEKDKNESPKPGGTKKDGTPAYFQPYNPNSLQPFGKHAYFAYLPTVKFGPGITSATEIRRAWPTLDDRRKTAMVMSLYPSTQQNPKLAATVVKLLDAGMSDSQLAESRIMDRDARINAYYVSKKGDKHRVAENIPYYLLDKLVPLLTKKYAITMNDIVVKPVDQSQYRRTSQPELAEGSNGVSVRGWANQVRKDHGTDIKFVNRKEGGGAVDTVRAINSQGETVGVYNRKTGYPTVFEPKQGVAEGSKHKCTCHPGDSDPDCPVHGLEPMEVGDALDVKEGEEEALAYATQAHAGQTRSGGDPYITHPMRVADHIRKYKQSHNLDALISAAYLHDTIEDTDTTQEILHDLFGGLVASLVKELTSDPEQIKKMGKAAYLSHKMAAMSSYGLVIKLADRLDNVKDITTARTPQWRAKYAQETNQILDYIEKTRALSGTHNKLISLIRAKLAEIDNPPQVADEGITRRGILKGIAGAGALGAAGKASAIAGAFPTPSAQQAMYKAAADSNRAEAKRQAELKAKADSERLQKNTQEVDREQRVNHHKLDEFAPGNGDDDRPTAEYEVYQCQPDDQFEWIGGPLLQTDSMGNAHSLAYELWKKHPDKCFMIWQERSQGSRGGYGPKGSVLGPDEDDVTENNDYLDEK